MKTTTDKAGRHEVIARLLGERIVRTQAELKSLLAHEGHRVDQATLSRDLRELGVAKVSGQDGEGTHYALMTAPAAGPTDDAVALVARMVKAADWSGSLVVVQTAPGNASPLGLALDRLQWKEILGTVAGDDTLLIVVREGTKARAVAERIKAIARR